MKKSIFRKVDWIGFISNCAAVILGIVITFTIQGIIDKSNEKEDVRSALALVKDELNGCLSDIRQCAEIMDMEHYCSLYFQRHAGKIDECPADSLTKYGQILLNEMILTLPDDALELLKSSSLFPKIGDNKLALKVIRAYDQCEALSTIFRRSEQIKTERVSNARKTTEIKMSELAKTEDGLRLIYSLGIQDGTNIRNGIPDIEEAIMAIDEYLEK